MKSIYKYPLTGNSARRRIQAPITKILCVQVQNNEICLWAEVDTETEDRMIDILLLGTGWDLSELQGELKFASYIGTVQQGMLVWHCYYKIAR